MTQTDSSSGDTVISLPSPLPVDKGERFPALDGLRGLAVLLVLLDHASDAELRIFPGADMYRAGKYGVYLFFVLSAFLLTHLLLLRPAAELASARTWLTYALRRFLRIFPLYLMVLVVFLLLHKLKAHDLWTHLLLLDGKRQFWTIPVEVKYYFVLPWVVVAMSSFGNRAWTRGVLASVGAVLCGAVIFYLERRWSISEAVYLAHNLEPFILGSLAALVHRALAWRYHQVARYAWWFEGAAILGLALSLLRLPSVYNEVFYFLKPIRKFAFDSLVCGVLWTAVLLGLLHGTGYVRRIMEWAPLRFLGLVSYSAYLWHTKFLTDVDDMPIPLPLRLLVFLIVVLAVATVSYFSIERPLSRFRLAGNHLLVVEPTLPKP